MVNNFGQMNLMDFQPLDDGIIRNSPTQIRKIKNFTNDLNNELFRFFNLISMTSEGGRMFTMLYGEKMIYIDKTATKLNVDYYNILNCEVFINLNLSIKEIVTQIFAQIFCPNVVKKIHKRTHENQTTDFIILNPIDVFDEENSFFMYKNFLYLEFKGQNLSQFSEYSGNYLGLKEGDKLSLKLYKEFFEEINALPKIGNVILYFKGYSHPFGVFSPSYKGMTFGEFRKIFNEKKLQQFDYTDNVIINPSKTPKIEYEVRNWGLKGCGIYEGINFVVPSNSSIKKINLGKNALKWRLILPGLNLLGICKNKKCIAYKKEVIYTTLERSQIPEEGFIFDMLESSNKIKCPMCNKIFLPNTCGFYKCEYQFIGEKLEDGDEVHYDSQPKEAKEDNLLYYNPKKGKEAKWFKLKIYVLPIQEIKYKSN